METFILGVLAGIFVYLFVNFVKSGKLKLYYDELVLFLKSKINNDVTTIETKISDIELIIADFEQRIANLESSSTTTSTTTDLPLL